MHRTVKILSLVNKMYIINAALLEKYCDLFSDRQKSHAQSGNGTKGSERGENTLSAKASIYS